MVGAICGAEIVPKERTRINACLILRFTISTMLEMTFIFRNCELALILDCINKADKLIMYFVGLHIVNRSFKISY